MRTLIVTYDMVPHAFTWGGCQRMYFLVKKLKALGIDTQVVAMRSASFNTFGKEVFEDTIFTEPKTEIKAGNSNGTAPNKSTGASGFIRKAAFIGDTFFFNEIQAGNGIKAYQRYRNAKGTLIKIVTQQKYDVAIVSGPPFVVFDAIPLIKKHSPGTRVVMDYRDPWNFWHMGNLLTTQREKRIQRIADTIVCTNDALCADMSVAFGIPSSKYHVIANGYAEDLEHLELPEISSKRFEVVYTGAIAFNDVIDSYRDTSQLIAALRELINEGVNDITLTFVGASNPNTDESKSLKHEFGEAINIVGHVSSKEAKEYVAKGSACLLLHTTNDASGKYLINGKLYDYIQQKKYVLSIASKQSQHAALLKKYSIGINAENNKEDIKRMLLSARSLWKDHQLEIAYNNVDIHVFSRDTQIKKYIDLIKQL